MFGAKRQGIGKEPEVKTLIGEGSEFEGNLKLTGGTAARIDGSIKGNVYGQATLIVGKEGRIEGNLEVEVAIIYGLVEGNIRAESVELHGGVVRGDIATKSLLVEKGSIFNGRCIMEEFSKRGSEAPSLQSSKVETSPTGSPSS